MSNLLSVADARARMLREASPTEVTDVSLAAALGMVAARDLTAHRTQPPFPSSAMDGYAVRAADLSKLPCRLSVIGQSAAGHGFTGAVGPGEAVRIFTGAPVPQGADTIVIQENTVLTESGSVQVNETARIGLFVRPAGLDFSKGETLICAGTVLDPVTLSLAAAMNHAKIPVRRPPRVSVIASGDELVMPGGDPGPDQIVSSNNFGVAAIASNTGGDATSLGIAADTMAALEEKLSQTACSEADIVVTLGGASVGDHDLVRPALEKRGIELAFWKIAMRPGKPLMFGTNQVDGRTICYLGLPGNPISSLVCAHIFLVPLIKKMLGLDPETLSLPATLAVDVGPGGQREEYMRAVSVNTNGERRVTPFENQDSSLLSVMAKANCLLLRPIGAAKARAGDACHILPL